MEHPGVVLEVGERSVEVRMTVGTACKGCSAKAVCGGEESERVVTVWTDLAGHFSVGEEVAVSVTTAMGVKAVVWAYIVPVFVMAGTLVGLKNIGFSETVVGLSSLSAVAVYYFFLYVFRGKLEKVIVFKLRKIGNI